MSENPLTFNQTVFAITEFIEVAIHTILYVRQVYPAEIFVRRKKYDTPVFQSRHPSLNQYVSGAVKAIGDELIHGKVDKVIVVIKDKEQVPLERFIFSIETMIEVDGFNKDTSVEEAISAVSLGQYFRAFLVKLNMIESQIGQMHLGDNVSFAIIIEFKDDVAPTHSNTKDPPPWIPAMSQDTSAGASDDSELHMVRAVNTGIINVSLTVQESGEKVLREQRRRAAEKLEEIPVEHKNKDEPKVG
ncbi:DNA-binding protein [Pholiota conissans]|uniref:DNA-binding protein n=1 Tax=Pholiota conissans TaxID=109636 RepID=A0A9P5Z4T9_9AGAR|nr:DNA-binding protein [Pholiota conissans]